MLSKNIFFEIKTIIRFNQDKDYIKEINNNNIFKLIKINLEKGKDIINDEQNQLLGDIINID